MSRVLGSVVSGISVWVIALLRRACLPWGTLGLQGIAADPCRVDLPLVFWEVMGNHSVTAKPVFTLL